ncbi:MAG TPA: S49 family peptidase [Propionibacterium sp.]|nr:S49 family peptidase [Propionibacterium sp.]
MDDTTRPDDIPRPAPSPADAPPPAAHGVPPVPPRQQAAPLPYAPAPSRPAPFKRGFGLGAGAGLGFGGAMLVLGLVGSLISGLMLMGFAGAASTMAAGGQTGVEPLNTVWGPSTATSKLRAIPVTGAIMTLGADGFALSEGTYGYEVADVIDGLDAEDADGLVLMLDTPGGTVTGSKAISDAVDRYRERTGKKAFAFVQGQSASGGMYAMAGADEIIADHGTTVGSVGVIMGPLERYRDVTAMGSILGAVEAGEITQEYITAGKGKDAGQPFRDLTAEERAMLNDIITEMYDDFVNHVSTKRGIDRAVLVDELGAGIFTGKKAEQVGYIDGTMGRDEAMRHFATEAGLDPADTRLVQSSAPGFLASFLGAEARAWGVAPAAQSVAGQPAKATASLCTDPTEPLLWHGNLVGVCR